MRTPAVQAKQNDSRYRWASRSGNVSAPQSRHNRPPKSNAPPFSCQKSCPRSSFGRFYAPPAAHGRPRWHGWWKFLRLPNICAWSFRPAQNICGLTALVEVGRGGGAQSRPKLERWHVFRMGHAFQTSPIQHGIALPMYFMCRWHIKHRFALKMRPLRRKCSTKCNPFVRNCVGASRFEAF